MAWRLTSYPKGSRRFNTSIIPCWLAICSAEQLSWLILWQRHSSCEPENLEIWIQDLISCVDISSVFHEGIQQYNTVTSACSKKWCAPLLPYRIMWDQLDDEINHLRLHCHRGWHKPLDAVDVLLRIRSWIRMHTAMRKTPTNNKSSPKSKWSSSGIHCWLRQFWDFSEE